MSDLPLRAACIHGRYEAHQAGFVGDEPCSGGRDVTIDHEAAYAIYSEHQYGPDGTLRLSPMSDLPSREALKSLVQGHGPRQEYPSLAPILDAYVSGRLVDLEAIDWKAITAIIDSVAARVDSEGVTGHFRAEDYTTKIVAAIGVTD